MPNGSAPPPAPPPPPGWQPQSGPPHSPPSHLPPPTQPPIPPAPPSSFGTTRPPLQPPATGVRKAVVVLMWITVAAEALTAIAAFARQRTWDRFVDNDASLTDIDDADNLIAGAVVLTLMLLLATSIVLAVWSYRAASNAAARGASTSPGLAAGGWYIPIGNLFVPHGQLRKCLGGRGDTAAVNWWQGLWIAGAVIGNAGVRVFGDFDLDDSPNDVSADLRNQGIALVIGAVLLAAAAYFATRAMRSIDEVTTGAA